MSKDEDTIRREAAAMQQGQFQGEVLVSLEQLKDSDTKQWDKINDLEAAENQRKGMFKVLFWLVTPIGLIFAAFFGAIGSWIASKLGLK